METNNKKIGRPKDPKAWSVRRCKACGVKFEARRCYTKRGQMKYCSYTCGYPNSGSRNGRWKGGVRIDNGYIKIYSPNHPLKDSTKYVMKHRLVMEKKLGRYLKRQEVVHHKNHVKTDNKISNLMLFTNHSKHMKVCRKKA